MSGEPGQLNGLSKGWLHKSGLENWGAFLDTILQDSSVRITQALLHDFFVKVDRVKSLQQIKDTATFDHLHSALIIYHPTTATVYTC